MLKMASRLSNYAACHNDTESAIAQDNSGMMLLNVPVRELEVTDGLSNTILLGEKMIERGDLGWLSGTRSTLRNTGTSLEGNMTKLEQIDLQNKEAAFVWDEKSDTKETSASDEELAAGSRSFVVNEDAAIRQYVGGFQSHHLDVVNFVMGDGSVHSLSNDTDPAVMQLLGGRADGKLLTEGPSRIEW